MKLDLGNFKIWLISDKELTSKSASDVCSRIRRLVKICPSFDFVEYEKSLYWLNKDEYFLSLSVNVKSQIRGAIQHYLKFKASPQHFHNQ